MLSKALVIALFDCGEFFMNSRYCTIVRDSNGISIKISFELQNSKNFLNEEQYFVIVEDFRESQTLLVIFSLRSIEQSRQNDCCRMTCRIKK